MITLEAQNSCVPAEEDCNAMINDMAEEARSRDDIVEHKACKSTTHKLNKLMRYDVAAQFLLRLRSSHIYNFQKELESEGSAPKTINIYVQLLHQIWTTAKKKWSINLPAQSPFELVTLEKVDNERDRVLTY